MKTITFTHKGRFGLCPVYIANVDSDAPDVHERHWLFKPLFVLSVGIFELCFALQQLADPLAEPEWSFEITGELQPPITMQVEGA